MHNVLNKKRALLLLAILGIWAMLMGGAVADDASRVRDLTDGFRTVEVVGGIMKVNKEAGSFMTLNETTIVTGKYRAKGQLLKTRFLDQNGEEVSFQQLVPNLRIIVRGYQVDRTVVFAESVQIKGKYMLKGKRTIPKLKPKSAP